MSVPSEEVRQRARNRCEYCHLPQRLRRPRLAQRRISRYN